MFPAWQADALPLSHLGIPYIYILSFLISFPSGSPQSTA